MNKWNLDSLYKDFGTQYQNDLKSLQTLGEKFLSTVDSLGTDKQKSIETVVKYYEEVMPLFFKLSAFPRLIVSTDVKNQEASANLGRVMAFVPVKSKIDVKVANYLKDCDLDDLCTKSEIIKTYKYYLSALKSKTEHMLSENEEVLIAELNLSGGNAWSKLALSLPANLLVDIELEGKTQKLPLAQVRNLAFSSDKEIRKVAYFAELEAYKQIEDVQAMCLSNIKMQSSTVSKKRGFKSILDEMCDHNRISKETLDALLSAMDDYLVHFRRYLSKKAEYLGHKKGLPFYDLFAPVGEFSKTYTYEEAQEIVLENFRSFSSKMENVAKRAIENKWIDVEPREGKRGGAFCSNLNFINESRIMLNFTGSFGNVTTMAHELGHAYHGSVLASEPNLNWSYTMPVAETASNMCETILTQNFMEKLSDSEKLGLLESNISDANQVVTDIFSRFKFETEVINQTHDKTLSSEELCALMVKAQKETYGDAMNYEYLHPYMWANKSHYYSTGLHFYNYPYAFGSLFSLGLYSKYLENKEEFVKKYDDLLIETGKNTCEEVAKVMDIDITKKEFWTTSLEQIKKDIDLFCILIDKELSK